MTLRSGKQFPEVEHKIEQPRDEPKQTQVEGDKPRSDELKTKQTKIPCLQFPQTMNNGTLDK